MSSSAFASCACSDEFDGDKELDFDFPDSFPSVLGVGGWAR